MGEGQRPAGAGKGEEMKLTAKQVSALERVGIGGRVNLHELGRTGTSLLRHGLIGKNWNRNDASGEAVTLTEKGNAEFSRRFC